MMRFSELVNHLPQSRFIGDTEFNSVSTDTRSLKGGDVFIALQGENFDGHDFIESAIDKGAVGIVVAKEYKETTIPQLIVTDTTKALGQIAAVKRAEYRGKLISLTGSSGKTSVKAMLESICAQVGKVRATQGNLNNHIGVPLTLLSLDGTEKFAIVEAGTSGLGEIAYLAQMIKPNIALVNNIQAAHLEGLLSLDNVAKEKSDLYRFISEGGCAVINLNDHYAGNFLELNKMRKCIGFCLEAHSHGEIQTLVLGKVLDQNASLEITLGREVTQVKLQVLGESNIKNALAAAACAVAAGISLADIKKGLEAFVGVKGRMEIVAAPRVKQLINDTYNANPGSVDAALTYLSKQENSVFIFGGMGELGDQTVSAHEHVGRRASELKIGKVYCVGANTQYVIENFTGSGQWFATQAELLAALSTQDLLNASVLVKGSRFTKMENVVHSIVNWGDKRNAGMAG